MPQRQQIPRESARPRLQRAEQEELLLKGGISKPDLEHPSPATMLQLQRTIGNRATRQLITQKSPFPTVQRTPVKTKLMEYMFNVHHGDSVNRIAAHIYDVITALETGNWAGAYELLYDNAMAGSVGHHINLHFKVINPTDKTQEEIDKEVNLAIGKGMYFVGKLDLPDVAVYATMDDIKNPENDAHLAQMVLPVVLEEWIHMFQHMIHDVLSDGTKEFMNSPQVIDNQQLPNGGGRWNMNEVDIYAIYKELGWDIVLSAFKARYPERIKYEEFTEVLRRGNFTRRGRHI